VRFGCCAGVDKVAAVAEAGCDYIELPVSATVAPLEGPEKFSDAQAALGAAPITAEVFNLFIPGEVKVVGPEADGSRVERYVSTACRRVSALGGRIIVFGSGGARRRPDGFPVDKAMEQMQGLLALAGEAAQKNGIRIAVEPLRQAETNVVNSVTEGDELVRRVKHPGVALLADLYHMAAQDEPMTVLSGVADRLIHVHLAEPPDRTAPGVTGYDFRPFFRALLEAGYSGRISIECRWQDFEAELPEALAVLRSQWAAVAS